MDRLWSVLFGVVNLAALLLFVVAPSMDWWLPKLENEGSYGSDADALFYWILGATGFFFILTEAILVYCLYKYTYNPNRKAVYTHGNHRLEMAWTIVPGVILLIIAFVQISTWADIKYVGKMPVPDVILDTSARQFEWRMRYPNPDTQEQLIKAWKEENNQGPADTWGKNRNASISDLHLVNEVHTWKGAKTRLYLSTKDVLHSFFLPNLRLKQDAVPGKVIPVWFEATNHNVEWDGKKLVGKPWALACAELCGWGHYKMKGHFYVHKDKESYLAWLRDAIAKQESRQASP